MPQHGELPRIERHRRDRAAIAGEDGRDAGGEAAVAVEPAFQLEQHGGAAGDQIAQFAERHHALGAVAERDALERGRGHRGRAGPRRR